MPEENGLLAPALTRDNTHLSRPILPAPQIASDDNCSKNSFAGCADPKILEFIAAATSPDTRRAYQSDIEHFIARGGCIPAIPEQVARYLADHAATLSMATLARRLAGIRAAHVERGFPDPTKGELIRLTFRGFRRKYGRPQRRVAALTIKHLMGIISSFGNSTRDIRDRALLLIGFAGAFRRSELCTIQRNWIGQIRHGISISLHKTKTDQENIGRDVIIPLIGGSFCPVAALTAWLEVSKIANGPVFRPLSKAGKILSSRLTAGAVAVIVKQRVAEIGLDPAIYSGHSLRAGFATSAAAAGLSNWEIKHQTGHASDRILAQYIRDAEPLASITTLFEQSLAKN